MLLFRKVVENSSIIGPKQCTKLLGLCSHKDILSMKERNASKWALCQIHRNVEEMVEFRWTEKRKACNIKFTYISSGPSIHPIYSVSCFSRKSGVSFGDVSTNSTSPCFQVIDFTRLSENLLWLWEWGHWDSNSSKIFSRCTCGMNMNTLSHSGVIIFKKNSEN